MSFSLQYYYLIFNVIFGSIISQSNASFLDWLWVKNEEKNNFVHDASLISIPFESKTEDEKFLEEAAKFTDIIKSSTLDICQHKVILKIKTSCSSMTEEELAKMSVNLLNCQSAVDGRPIFPCTESMSLKECTVKMDATMWNAYHMMNNRARAVCMAARRSQFQALSEMTVNKLMSAAHDQIKKMNLMIDGQHQLEKLTLGTMNIIEKGNIELLEQQDQLKSSQKGIQDFVSHNLRQFVKEKALIASGHKELSKMIANIKKKLDEANMQLYSQSEVRLEHQRQLLADISIVQQQTKEIFDRIDISTDKLLHQHAEAASKYHETMKNLVKINETVHYLLGLISATRAEIDEKFHWIQDFLGGTGMQIGRISAVVYHIGYLLLGMLFASFLNFATISRVVLTLVVPLNLFTSYTGMSDYALDYAQMTMVLATTALTIALVNRLMKTRDIQMYLERRRAGNNASQSEAEFRRRRPNIFQIFRRVHEKLKSFLSSRMATDNHWTKRSMNYSPSENYTTEPENFKFGSPTADSGDETQCLPVEQPDAVNCSEPHCVPERVSSHRLVQEWLQTKVAASPSVYSGSSSSQRMCSAISRSTLRRCRNVSSRGNDFCFKHMRERYETS